MHESVDPTVPRSRRTPRLLSAVAVVGLALATIAVPAGASRHGPAHDNKAVAREVVEELAEGDTEIVDRAFAPDYVDRTIFDGSDPGTAGLKARTEAESKAHPKARTRIYRVIAEGDLVFVHSNLILDKGTRGSAVADIYRFADGRIVEHWGGRQAVPATTVSGNDMFSTLSSPKRLSPDPKADVNQTKAVVFDLFGAIVGAKDLTAWDRLVQPPYYQHSVNTDNGAASVKAVWGPLLIAPDTVITSLALLAEGDLIVSAARLDTAQGSMLTFDISRVQNGLISEHWDVVQRLS